MQNSFWQGQRVLVTGATGLVGSWLTKELLANGAKVTALTRDLSPQSELVLSGQYKQVQIIRGGLESYETVERAISQSECSSIIHLAAQAIVSTARRSPLLTFESNIRGTYHVLEAARIHRDYVKAVVFASSDKAYGAAPNLPYFEDMPLAGEQPYEVSKSCGDLICQSYYKSYSTPVAVARCGNIYGGGDLNFSRIIPGTIRSLLLGERPQIRSDGTFVRDYIYVKDTVQAYLSLAQAVYEGRCLGEAFNFSPERPVSVLELVKLIQEKMSAQHLKPVIEDKACGEIHSQYLDSTKATKLLKWKPQFSLEEGLAETIDWYREFLSYTGELAKTTVRR